MAYSKKLAGYKGGSTTPPPQPIEVQDTIQSTGRAYVVDAWCEGEIEEIVNLFIDEAPYSSTDFPTVEFNSTTMFRKGLPRTTQSLLPARYTGAKVPIPVPQSNRIRKTRPIVMYFNSNTYPDATSLLINVKFPSMLRQVDDATKLPGETSGDIRETTVEYKVTLTENGAVAKIITEVVKEKSSGGFVWSTRVPLSPDATLTVNQWKIKIERVTADSTSVKLSNETHLDSVIVETNNNYNYPNTVVSAMSFDAQNFPNVGVRSADLKLLKVKVPNNYTPTEYDADGNVTAAAIYTGAWTGTFASSKVWTNNPAWVFYDLLTNRRYGLGEFIAEASVDKWTLYQIAKYCDTLVDKGNGEVGLNGQEPRFACNLFLTTSEEAYTVINNLASVFRGITYWMSGKIFPVQDKAKSFTQLFTNANVINGLFNYSTSAKGQRRTIVSVRWNDPNDFYRPAVEHVEDPEGIIRFGRRDFDIGAFACTSRGQAHRVGKWALLSERLETEIVNFETAGDGVAARPGDVIQIYDNFRFAQKQGGRVFDMDSAKTQVVLDRIVESGDGLSYKLNLNIPQSRRDPAYTGSDTSLQVTTESHIDDIRKTFIESADIIDMTYSGNKTVVEVDSAFSEQYIGGTWHVEANHPTSGTIYGAKEYRVLNMKETEDRNVAITALEYDESKFALAESGYTIRTSPTTDYGANPLVDPSGLDLEAVFKMQGETFSTYILASWTPSTGPFLSSHEASGRYSPTGTWTRLQVYENGSKANFYPTTTGTIEIKVHAVQVGGVTSSSISDTIAYGGSNPLGNDVISMSGIELLNHSRGIDNEYEERQPRFLLATAPSGEIDERRAFLEGIQFRMKDYLGVAKSDWFFVREDESVIIPYNFPSITGWPFRTGTIEARAIDYWQNTSSVESLTFSNPAPGIADINILSKDTNSFRYLLTPTSRIPDDFSGVLWWTSTGTSRPATFRTRSELAGELTHSLGSEQVYAWYALSDDFSHSGLNIVGPVQIDLGPLATDLTITLNLTGHLDNYLNVHNTLYATWNRVDSGNVSDYYIYLKDSSGALYNYIVPQPDSGSNPFFHFDSVVPDRTYQVAIRARNNEGRKSPLTAYTTPALLVPKPTIRHWRVEGEIEASSLKHYDSGTYPDTKIDLTNGTIVKNANDMGGWTMNGVATDSRLNWLLG